MADFLGLINELPDAKLSYTRLQKGDVLFHENDPGDAMYVVMKGQLQVLIKNETGQHVEVGKINEGEPLGEMQLLTGGKRTATVLALVDTVLVTIPSQLADQLSKEYPAFHEALKRLIMERLRSNHLQLLLPDLFGTMEEADFRTLEEEIDWCYLRKGERLIQQGDAGDAMYIVLSGRLHVLVEDLDGHEKVVLQIGRGEIVGEMALFNEDPRSANVDAVRDCILVSISKSAFFTTMARFPKLHEHVTRVIMRRLHLSARPSKPAMSAVNIAILPLDASLACSKLARDLKDTISFFGSTLLVSRNNLSELADFRPEVEWFEDQSDSLRLAVWLDKIELKHHFIIFEADPTPSSWTKRLIQHADLVLLLADATSSPYLTELEQECLGAITPGQQVLLLQHPETAALPTGTASWLAPRDVKQHLHIRHNNREDLTRVARILAGRATGLVLGGGGARGFAHIGVIKAFRAAGIPIDMVGGTSMGAVFATQAAMELDADEMVVRNRRAWVEERPFRKHMLPIFSFYRSKKLDEVTHQILYQDICIEDLWLPCFIVSCSLGTSELVVHERGKVWEAIRASTALPGVVTPVPDGRFLHVDGGLMNNLPVDLMRERSEGPIIAVEVGDMADINAQGLLPPSLFDYFRTKWFSRKPGSFPTILEILMRSLLLGSRQNVKQARRVADLILSPPVEEFGLLEFEAIERVASIGYSYAQKELARWQDSITVTKVI